MPSLTINGVNTRDLGFYIRHTPRFRSLPTRTLATAQVLGTMGATLLGTSSYPAKVLPLQGTLVKRTYAARAQAEDDLKTLVGGSLVTIVRDDGVTVRRTLGILTEGDLLPFDPQLKSGADQVGFQFLCPFPVWEDHEPRIVHLAAAANRYSLPLGTAPTLPSVLEIFGGATNPELKVRTAGGTVAWSLGFTVTLTSSEALLINVLDRTITKYSSGTASDGIGLLNLSDQMNFPKAFDPHDGAAAQYATIEVSAGTARVIYRKAWL